MNAVHELPGDRPFDDDTSRWEAVVGRDPRADGKFVFCVKTTGVYCKPSCAARLARRENVSFHTSCDAAEAAGYRPCKRCKPDEAAADSRLAGVVARLCRLIETSETAPTLAALAREAAMSPFHLQRVFKRITGLSPRDYAIAHRARRVRESLNPETTVTEALYAAGYGSSGRFYENADAALGMEPSRYKSGGEGADIRFAIARCSLGCVLVGTSGKGVCAVLLGDSADDLARELKARFPSARLVARDSDFARLLDDVVSLVEHPERPIELPLDVRGTAFQLRVWQALRQIPPGTTVTYSDLAAKVGAPKAVRAVANACAANVLAVAVPCHRVVRSDGGVGGYRWGVERKRALLDREGEP
ncbi:MAG: bifunctional DNA-binding transcriptional regulator/O6-methylguanine-DNA methyltransferase Ada [Betaproteobacteria bacterium]|nr:bifunctional DNA-binding transcriptional regulator/O6-methylguanine-DNA methyltransferase Ada [Betaproteobacteria bacterium]